MFNRRYPRAWLKPPQSRRTRRRKDERQMELNFCGEPWRPLVVWAKAAELVDRGTMTSEEYLAAEFERLFPCK